MEEIPKTADAKNWPRWLTSISLGTIQLPGWAMLLLAIIIGVPDWKSRYEFWLATAQSTEGRIAMLAPILGHPYFPGAIAITGVLYLVIVGTPGQSIFRHKWLPFAGWAAIAVCVSAMIVTAGYGAIEIYIRREISKGIAGIPRNTPDENNPIRPQPPLSMKDDYLQPDQIRILLREFSQLRQIIKNILFAYPPNNNDSYGIFSQYQNVLTRSGINAIIMEQLPRGPEEEGIMLEVHDTNSISEPAEKFIEALVVANIYPK